MGMDKRRQPWITNEALEAGRAFFAREGYVPAFKELCAPCGLPAPDTVCSLFGSVKDFRRALAESLGLRERRDTQPCRCCGGEFTPREEGNTICRPCKLVLNRNESGDWMTGVPVR